MIELVVWGAGRRGERLRQLLGNKILAFIDKEHSLSTNLGDIPIISFEEYKKRFWGCPIVVSPLFNQEILEVLQGYRDISMLSMVEEPSEISLGLTVPFEKMEIKRFCKDRPLYLLGVNIFSMLLYDYMQERGWNNIRFLPGSTGITAEAASKLGIEVAEQPEM